MTQLLALFPLNLVLFPGMTLPLHIFEPRYKQMINRCIQLKQPFGVVLIQDGEAEAEYEGQPVAEPYTIGTTAQIREVMRFEDGRMLLASIGDQRFRVEEIVQREPYLVASVEMLDDEVSPEAAPLADEIKTLYGRHQVALANATGVEQPEETLADDPLTLSYQLADQFRIINYSKQQLLEADVEDRLAAIREALERELQLLPPVPDKPRQTSSGPWSIN